MRVLKLRTNDKQEKPKEGQHVLAIFGNHLISGVIRDANSKQWYLETYNGQTCNPYLSDLILDSRIEKAKAVII